MLPSTQCLVRRPANTGPMHAYVGIFANAFHVGTKLAQCTAYAECSKEIVSHRVTTRMLLLCLLFQPVSFVLGRRVKDIPLPATPWTDF